MFIPVQLALLHDTNDCGLKKKGVSGLVYSVQALERMT